MKIETKEIKNEQLLNVLKNVPHLGQVTFAAVGEEYGTIAVISKNSCFHIVANCIKHGGACTLQTVLQF